MKKKNLATLAMLGIAGGLLVSAQNAQQQTNSNTPSTTDSQGYNTPAPNSCAGQQYKNKNTNNGNNSNAPTNTPNNADRSYSSNGCGSSPANSYRNYSSNSCSSPAPRDDRNVTYQPHSCGSSSNTRNASSPSFNSRLNDQFEDSCGAGSCSGKDDKAQSNSLKNKRQGR